MRGDLIKYNYAFLCIICILFIFINGYSSTSAVALSRSIDFAELEADSLYASIKAVEFSDIYEVKKSATALQNIPHNKKAQIIGDYYSKIASFYISGNEDLINDIDSLYVQFVGKEYEYIRLEIDLLLIDYFFGKSDYERSSKILERTLDYILKPEYSLERASIIYGLPSNTSFLNEDDSPEEVYAVLEEYKDLPWNIYLSKIYRGIGITLLRRGEKEKVEEIFTYGLDKNLEAGFINEALSYINAINNISSDTELQKKAIELSIESGYTYQLDVYYRVLGHKYMGNKIYDKAFDAYQSAYKQDVKTNTDFDKALDLGYMGWAYFNINPKENIAKADEYYQKSLEIADTLYLVPKKMALERMLWSYNTVGDKNKRDEILKELEGVKISQSNNKKEMQNFYLINYLKFKEKDHQINQLSLTKELHQEIIDKQKQISFYSILLLVFIVGILYYYYQKYKVAKELNNKNEIIQSKNKELNVLISKLEESNRLLENFAHTAAHDIKAPLRTISGFSQALQKKHYEKLPPKDRELFDFITSGCNELSHLVNGLLDFSTLTTNLDAPVNININNLFIQVKNNLRSSIDDNDVELNIEESIPETLAHRSLVSQLLLNLIGNSIKYSQRDVQNSISVGYKEKRDGYNIYYVEDKGIGIPIDKQKDVFGLFNKLHSSAEYEGNGIGLATCQKIIDFYGGEICLESEEGVGTTIYFSLPIAKYTKD